MNRVASITALALALATPALAGAPQPDQRQGEFVHVCRGGPNKADLCSVATEEQDCPGSECVVQALGGSIKGTLTLIAHDAVIDWANGGATNRALTVLLEVRGPDGTAQLLSATYQNLADPTLPPTAPGSVVAIDMDEPALRNLAAAPSGLTFAQPDVTLADQLRTIFGSTGTPVLIATDRKAQSADHTTDGLATVVRFKVKVQFLVPIL